MSLESENLSGADFARLKSALDEAAILAITDKKGVITYANQKFCAISKFSLEELIGNTHRIINSGVHPKEFFAAMWKTITSGKVWEGEICNRTKNGELYWVNTTIVPFLDENGNPEKYVAVRYEVTERKAAEEKLKLQAKKLELSNRELQDFASVAAHDLQEPLRKIQSFSDRLKLKAQAELKPESLDYVNRIQNSAQRMQILINDLLTYSRVTTKAQPFSILDLNQVVAQVVSDLEVRLEQSKGVVEWKDLPFLQADGVQMNQLFLNLIGNALKFHKPGVQPCVQVTARVLEDSPLPAPGSAVQVTVADNGIGFDEKYLDRIFTIFQRLHGRHEYEGTGIGLAVCRKIVDRHGGIITASSEPGQGAKFIFTLPARQNGVENT